MKLGKLTIIFIIMGVVYLNVEIGVRAIMGSLVGFNGIKFVSFAGWTSWWMFPIGGIIGVILGKLNETEKLKKHKMIIHCLIGAAIILAVELITGIILNMWWGLAIWDYSTMPLQILGQICVPFGILWMLLCPFAFWLDDLIRYNLYNEDTKYSLWRPYKRLFTLK